MRATEALPAAALLLLAVAAAAAPPALQVSARGDELTGQTLVWQRCALGQRWTGRICDGPALLLDRSAAQTAASLFAQQTGVAWRLPRATELRRLAQLRAQAPDEGRTLLPPPTLLWSSSTRVDTREYNPYDYRNIQRGLSADSVNRVEFMHGLAVDLAGAEIVVQPKTTQLAVRLVRER